MLTVKDLKKIIENLSDDAKIAFKWNGIQDCGAVMLPTEVYETVELDEDENDTDKKVLMIYSDRCPSNSLHRDNYEQETLIWKLRKVTPKTIRESEKEENKK